jgi:sucrose-6-phosphate hydrolase SacC (GH32 family)
MNRRSSSPFEVQADLNILSASQVGMILSNKDDDHITVGYDIPCGKLFSDRKQTGNVDFAPSFGRNIHSAPLVLDDQKLNLDVFFDASSIEVFANGGVINLTDLVFLENGIESIEIYAVDGDVLIENLDAWLLKGIWDTGITETDSP